ASIELILMDIDLGRGMDGPQAAALILAQRDIPIVFLSSHIEPEIVQKTEKITSYGYVVKNSGDTVLLTSIKMAFRLHDAHLIIQTQKSDILKTNADLIKTIDDLQTTNAKCEIQNNELIRSQNEIVERDYALRLNENKHRIILEESTDPIFSFASDGTYIYANKIYASMLGKAPEEVIGKRISDFFPPDEATPRIAAVKSVFETGEMVGLEVRFPYPSGDLYYMTSIKPVKDDKGKVVTVICIGKDITERKRMETALVENSSYLEKIISNAPFGAHFYYLDAHGDLIFDGNNFAADGILGIDHSKSVNKRMEDIFPGIEKSGVLARCKKTALTGESFDHEYIISDNNEITNAYEIRAFSTAPGKMAVFFTDITDKIRMTRDLEESEKVYHDTFEHAAAGIAHISPEGSYIRVNQLLCDMTGYSRSELITKSLTDIIHPDDSIQNSQKIEKLISGELETFSSEKRYIRKDKTHIWVEETMSAVRDGNTSCLYLISVGCDITARKKTESHLQQIQELYTLVSDNADDVIWIYDLPTNRFTYVSPSVVKLRGFTPEEIYQQSMKDALTAESYNEVMRVFPETLRTYASEGKQARNHMTNLDQPRKDGSIVHTEAVTTLIPDEDGQATQILGVSRNITERVKAEGEIRKSSYLLERSQAIAKIGYLEVDLKTNVVWGSPAAANIFGFSTSELPFATFKESALPEYRPFLDEKFANLINDNQPYDLEYKIRRRSDNAVLDIHSMAEYDHQQQKVFGVIQDITEQKKIEESLRQSELRYRKITRTILDY
ncbi:MAG TPA: PAS domain S-box protein, partial [Spirochaetota bacterium]